MTRKFCRIIVWQYCICNLIIALLYCRTLFIWNDFRLQRLITSCLSQMVVKYNCQLRHNLFLNDMSPNLGQNDIRLQLIICPLYAYDYNKLGQLGGRLDILLRKDGRTERHTALNFVSNILEVPGKTSPMSVNWRGSSH